MIFFCGLLFVYLFSKVLDKLIEVISINLKLKIIFETIVLSYKAYNLLNHHIKKYFFRFQISRKKLC